MFSPFLWESNRRLLNVFFFWVSYWLFLSFKGQKNLIRTSLLYFCDVFWGLAGLPALPLVFFPRLGRTISSRIEGRMDCIVIPGSLVHFCPWFASEKENQARRRCENDQHSLHIWRQHGRLSQIPVWKQPNSLAVLFSFFLFFSACDAHRLAC